MTQLLLDLISNVYVYVFLGMAAGWAVRGRGERIVRIFIGVSLYFLVPAFAFFSLWSAPVRISGSGTVIAAALFVIAVCAFLALLWTRVLSAPFRDYCLPVAFLNSAYLAIPVNTLLWGNEGAAYTIIYNVVVTAAIFTAGIWWVSKKSALREIFRIPVIYAVAAALALNRAGVVPHPAFLKANAVLSAVTLPAMLVFVGYTVSGIPIRSFRRAAAGVVLRMAGGYAAALAVVALMGAEGALAGVCLVTSAMPAAVQTYIIAEQFDSNPGFAASSVALGTLAAFVTIPLVRALLP